MDEAVGKTKLPEIEEKIRQLYKSTGDLWRDKTTPEQLQQIEDLLLERRNILNSLFLGNEEEMSHLKRVNEHLSYLRKELHRRVAAMKQNIKIDPTFDDDFEVKGTLEVHYNDETSVLTLKDDTYYGSDFRLMNEVLESFYLLIQKSCIGLPINSGVDQKLDNKICDDWYGVPICYAPYDLCFHKHYSILDAIRLDDFWADATLTTQSITTQSGKRFIPPQRK